MLNFVKQFVLEFSRREEHFMMGLGVDESVKGLKATAEVAGWGDIRNLTVDKLQKQNKG
jgi:hypothetical protein